jgi:hypothetical protein
MFGAVAAPLMAVSIVASGRPALPAARPDPSVSIRAE